MEWKNKGQKETSLLKVLPFFYKQPQPQILSWSWICLVVPNILGSDLFSRIFGLIFFVLCFGIYMFKSIIIFSATLYFLLLWISLKITFSDVAVVCANFNEKRRWENLIYRSSEQWSIVVTVLWAGRFFNKLFSFWPISVLLPFFSETVKVFSINNFLWEPILLNLVSLTCPSLQMLGKI